MNKKWLSLSIVVGLVFMLAPPAWPDFQAGLDAYDRGDYDTALKELRPLAEQGHAKAQSNLGGMYALGKGVPQDYTEAVKWFRLAAANGVKEAVNNRDILEKHMTPDQLAEAQKLAREWKAKGK